jgi:iron-sulfur cluster assembly protein
LLTLTDEAVSVVRRLTSEPESPPSTGVRISSDPQTGGLGLSLVTEPAPGDAVVENAGAQVYLDPDANQRLTDQTLDAVVDTQGQVNFSITTAAG